MYGHSVNPYILAVSEMTGTYLLPAFNKMSKYYHVTLRYYKQKW